MTNAASVSVAVASYQVDLRSRVSGERVLGTASGWFAGADACRARLAVRVVCGGKGRVARTSAK